MWAGIDFGSKTAGTTVICIGNNKQPLDLVASVKKQDADAMLLSVLKGAKPEFATIDAPLSLPGVYLNTSQKTDYFYRSVDVNLKAMSPMFIGGLTARAIRLKDECSQFQLPLFETYPAAFVKHFELTKYYQKKETAMLAPFIEALLEVFPAKVKHTQLPTWHHVDALIAWISCYRMAHDQHITFGDDEGHIFI